MSPPLRLGSSRPRPLWVGTRVGRGGGVEPIRAVSLRPPSRHPRRQRFVPHPAQPLPSSVQQRGGRDASAILAARKAVGIRLRSSERRGRTATYTLSL